MLTIRLSRHGRSKKPFFRIVLTEHTKSVKSGYKEVLGWYNPLEHTLEVDEEVVASWVKKGATLSERVAKLIYNKTKNDTFKKFVVMRERTRKSKKETEEVAAA
jgi:small subunit ribosomal protein S16